MVAASNQPKRDLLVEGGCKGMMSSSVSCDCLNVQLLCNFSAHDGETISKKAIVRKY